MTVSGLLKRKMLLASVIFIAVLPILASALFITYRSFQQAKLDAVDRAKLLLSHISEKQDELIAQTMQSLRILTQLPEVRNGRAGCNEFLGRFIANNPHYDNAGLVDAQGRVVCSGIKLSETVNVSDRDWFKLTLKTRTPQIGGLQFSKISGKPGIVAAMPVVFAEKKMAYVLYLAISVEWLEDVFAEFSLPEKSQITAIDTQGIVLFQHPLKIDDDSPLMGKPFPNDKIWKHIKAAGSIIQPARVVEEAAKKYIYTFERIEAEDRVAMVIALRVLESSIYRDATQNVVTLVLGLLLSLVATFLLAYVAGNYMFLRPVEQEIEKLIDVADTDPLTQILNRRGFERLTGELLARAQPGEKYALLAMDLDHFKKINDQYGHATGDEVLKETSARLRGVLRENELLARVGGEEFAIFIPQVARDNVMLLAERVRVAIGGIPFETGMGNLHVTASIGVAHRRPNVPLDKFMAEADKALYKGKRGGRNRVAI